MIKVNNLNFSYKKDGPFVLKGVNFLMKKNEFIALIGGNGSGKSTFVKILNGLLTGYEGSIEVLGNDPGKEDEVIEVRKKIGMVFQNPENQIVGAIVEDDTAFSLENLGFPRKEIRKRVDKALKASGLYEKRFSQTSDLSGGQTQRLAIAAMLALRPNIIVFDEATSMLDSKSRKEIFEIIKRLNREDGIGIIFISHFMDEVVEADRIIVMDSGSIVKDGTPSEVFNSIKLLEKSHVKMPDAKKIAFDLKNLGINIDWTKILTTDELYSYIDS